MGKVLKKENKPNIENIANEDWPLLKELETTRFALKNKKNTNKINQTLNLIKKESEKEDDLISIQNMADEKLVGEFLELKEDITQPNPTNINTANTNNEIKEVSEIKIDNNFAENNAVEVKEKTSDDLNIIKKDVVIEPIQKDFKVEKNKEDLSKLVAKGMAKVYIEKTDTILSPLQFLITHYKQILVGLVQFILPAIITWLLLTNVSVFTEVLNKENETWRYVYTGIFYFACLFISITAQVAFSGLINIFSIAFKNLATEAKK